jgi:putative hydrolase of the HAD superfamily
MPTNIEAVIFDYGNVLSVSQPASDIKRLERLTGVSGDRFQNLYWGGREVYDRGMQDGPTFWRMFAKAAGREFSDEQLRELIDADTASWTQLNSVMVGWLTKLQEAGIRTAILSNMGLDLHRHALEHFEWFQRCDHHSISWTVGSVKPEPAIYMHCLQGLGLAPDKVLFIDDRQENVAAADALGIRGILFEETQTFDEGIRAVGLPSPERSAVAIE